MKASYQNIMKPRTLQPRPLVEPQTILVITATVDMAGYYATSAKGAHRRTDQSVEIT